MRLFAPPNHCCERLETSRWCMLGEEACAPTHSFERPTTQRGVAPCTFSQVGRYQFHWSIIYNPPHTIWYSGNWNELGNTKLNLSNLSDSKRRVQNWIGKLTTKAKAPWEPAKKKHHKSLPKKAPWEPAKKSTIKVCQKKSTKRACQKKHHESLPKKAPWEPAKKNMRACQSSLNLSVGASKGLWEQPKLPSSGSCWFFMALVVFEPGSQNLALCKGLHQCSASAHTVNQGQLKTVPLLQSCSVLKISSFPILQLFCPMEKCNLKTWTTVAPCNSQLQNASFQHQLQLLLTQSGLSVDKW